MASDGPSQSATLHPSLGTVFPRQVSTSTSGLFSAGAPRGWGFGAPNPPLGPTGDIGPAPVSQMFGPSTALMDANSVSSSFGNVGFSSIHDFDESLVNPWGDVVSQPNRSGQPNLLGLGFSAASTPRPPQHVDLRPRTGRHQGWGFSGSDSSSPDPRSPSPSHHEPSPVPENPGDPTVLASGGGQERRHEFSPMRQSPSQPPPAGYAQGFPTYPPQQPNWPAFTQAQVPPNSFQHPGPYQHHPVFPASQHPFYSQPPFPPQQPFMPQQPFVPQQPIFPPVNPFYVQAPMPAPRERRLPRTEHGEVLKGNGTFHAWSLWARNLAKSEGLLSHISRPNEIGLRRTEQPSYPPPNADPNVDAVAATLHENWWVDDDAMRHILTSRLDPAIRASVPYVNPTTLEATTAREIWEYLWRNYGTGTTSAVLQRWKAISSRRIMADRVGDLPEYVAEFREIYECMLVARQPVTDESVLVALADAIPDLGGLAALSRDFRLAADHRTAEPITSHSAFEQLTHEVEVYLRRHPQPAKRAAKAGSSTGSKSSRVAVVCSNCKRVGHELEDCFQPGGPKEGKADEVRAARKARGSRTSGIAAVATPAAPTTAVTPTAVTSCAPDSAVVATPSLVAAALPANDQFYEFECYFAGVMTDDSGDGRSPPSHLFPPGFEFLLDSGCTSHIFNDLGLFHDYDESVSMKMKTANCGELETRGRGTVKLRLKGVNFRGRDLVLTLRDCVYSEHSATNLLSVGSFQQKNIGINYSFDNKTVISFGPNTPYAGVTFEALRLDRLSFLSAEPISPRQLPCAMIAKITSPPPAIWHRRLAHLGMADTRKILTGDYVTGVSYTGTFSDEICPPCVVGKGARQSNMNPGNRASRPLELVHIDICGRYNVSSTTGQQRGENLYFIVFLDDFTNYSHVALLKNREGPGILRVFQRVKAVWENRTGQRVLSLRMDGAREFIEGVFKRFMEDCGIEDQETAPYHHEQNGKAERMIRTLQDGSHALLADTLLPPSYWGDAVLTTHWVRNRVPTSTLPVNKTPYEMMFGSKPDISSFRAFGCLAWITIPPEKRMKESFRRQPAIFVGYELGRKGWWFVTLSGSHVFSADAVFDENTMGRLQKFPSATGIPTPSMLVKPPSDPNTRRAERLASLRSSARARPPSTPPVSMFLTRPDGRQEMVTYEIVCALITEGAATFSVLDSFVAQEAEVLEAVMVSTRADRGVFTRVHTFDTSRPPESWWEAIRRPDSGKWMNAAGREWKGLWEMGTFERCTLPHGQKAIGTKWVFAEKLNPDGSVLGEKARLVGLGCHQHPSSYGTTYAPVVSMIALRGLLGWAVKHDLEIMSIDVTSAFLHAPLHEPVYIKPVDGFPEAPGIVYLVKRSLYGFKQSAFEFYTFFKDQLVAIGLHCSPLDRALFVGIWNTPPHPSIPALADGRPLILFVPIHVDDGLGITNSVSLWKWFVKELSKTVNVKDMGPVSLYLGIRFVRDRAARRMWMTQRSYIADILQQQNLLNCKSQSVPLLHPLHDLPPVAPSATQGVSDSDVKTVFLRIVGWLLYLAYCTRPDIAYAAMALGQYSSDPNRSHLHAARGVLRYLSGTMDLSLSYPTSSAPVLKDSVATGSPVRLETCAIADADWATDSTDRRSISGYALYYCDSLVAWGATKQKAIALSSTEAELYALVNCLRQVAWFRMMIRSCRLPCPDPFPLFSDNQSTLAFIDSDAINNRTKHIDVRHHFIRDQVRSKKIVTGWLSTHDNTADIFTKPLQHTVFAHHRTYLGLVPLPKSVTFASPQV